MRRFYPLLGRMTLMMALILATAASCWAATGQTLRRGDVDLGVVPTRAQGHVRLAAFDVMARLAGAPGTVQNGDFVAKLGGHKLRLINMSAVAWIDYDLVAMPGTIAIEDDHCWVEAASGLRLLRQFVQLGGGMANLIWGRVAESTSEPIHEPTPEPASAPMAVVQPRRTTAVSALGATIRGLRWGGDDLRVRIVVDLLGRGTPGTIVTPGRAVIRLTSLDASLASRLVSPRRDVKLTVRSGASPSLIFDFPGRRAVVMQLDGPRRLVIDLVPIVGDSTATVQPSVPIVHPKPVAESAPKPKRTDSPINRSEPRETPPMVQQIQRPMPSHLPKPRLARPLVVIDPGHGGKDPGAMRGRYKEKIIALQIAMRLKTELERRGMDVRMTRTGDTYPTLPARTAFANALNASAFVSIHLNSLPISRAAVQGQEIYIMALPTDRDAMNLARAENADVAEGKSGASEDKTDMLMTILGNMQQNAKIAESTSLAEELYASGRSGGIIMRRVAQAPFAVLRGAAMPAVLVETGFITNPAEARRLSSPSYQQKIAVCLAEGFEKFFKKEVRSN